MQFLQGLSNFTVKLYNLKSWRFNQQPASCDVTTSSAMYASKKRELTQADEPWRPQGPKARLFTPRYMLKFYGVLPMAFTKVFVVVFVSAGLIYSVVKPDVMWTRKNGFPYEAYDPMDPKEQKFMVINQVYRPNPELNEALSYREEYKQMIEEEDAAKEAEKNKK